MREKIRCIAALLLSSAAIVALLTGTGLISLPVGTQETFNGQSARSVATGAKDTDGKPHQQSPPDYNPYPPGILPSNLNSGTVPPLIGVEIRALNMPDTFPA